MHFWTHREVGKLHDTLIIIIIGLKYCVTITVVHIRVTLFYKKYVEKTIMVLFVSSSFSARNDNLGSLEK